MLWFFDTFLINFKSTHWEKVNPWGLLRDKSWNTFPIYIEGDIRWLIISMQMWILHLVAVMKLPENEANKTRSAVSGSEVGREVAIGDACVICWDKVDCQGDIVWCMVVTSIGAQVSTTKSCFLSRSLYPPCSQWSQVITLAACSHITSGSIS